MTRLFHLAVIQSGSSVSILGVFTTVVQGFKGFDLKRCSLKGRLRTLLFQRCPSDPYFAKRLPCLWRLFVTMTIFLGPATYLRRRNFSLHHWNVLPAYQGLKGHFPILVPYWVSFKKKKLCRCFCKCCSAIILPRDGLRFHSDLWYFALPQQVGICGIMEWCHVMYWRNSLLGGRFLLPRLAIVKKLWYFLVWAHFLFINLQSCLCHVHPFNCFQALCLPTLPL